VKVLVFFIVGVYACAFGGSWLRERVDQVRSAVGQRVGTLHVLQELEAQQQRDYLAWLQGRTTVDVVRADEVHVRAARERLLDEMR
jgi:hypothetical protein